MLCRNEKDVKKHTKKILNDNGWYYFMPPANAYGRGGISDIVAVKYSCILVVETKFKSNKLTALQSRFLEDIIRHGGAGVVVNDRNLLAFDQLLNALNCALKLSGNIPDNIAGITRQFNTNHGYYP